MTSWNGLCTSSSEDQEKFVDAWVGKLLHFGCVTKSRAESSNIFVKKILSSSVSDLLAVFQENHLAIEHQ
ncbi:hypothetical protein PybrP1_013170, partial [[Pythium] brassicae (nom. inval.)]